MTKAIKPRPTADQWAQARAERETGGTFGQVALRLGVSSTAVKKRAKAEGWGDGRDVAAAIRRKVTEKVTGVVTCGNPKKNAELIDAAAQRGAEVIATHQAEWDSHRERFALPDDFEDAKLAKISAEMLILRQKGERTAHGLEEVQPQQQQQTFVGFRVEAA